MNNILQHYQGTKRSIGFEDSEKLNELLQKLASLLKPIQKELPFLTPSKPIGCIVGNPRSGTTLFQQWLASLGCFSYPSNLITRFAYAPYIGALIQQMLFDPAFDPQHDFRDLQSGINFESDLGKSRGALACNEFQHFFRNHMPNFDLEWLNEEALSRVDCAAMIHDLASVESAFDKPFTTKANILQFNIPYMAKRMESLFWIHIKRKPILNMQSIVLARKRYYGDQNIWLSAKPKEYRWLKELDVHHQVAGQVFFTEKSILEGLQSLPEDRWMVVNYESFCSNPKTVYEILQEKYKALGCALPKEYTGALTFKASNDYRLPARDIDALEEAYNKFETGHAHE